MYCNDLQYMRITSLAPLATCKVYTANCCGIILHLLLTATNKKNQYLNYSNHEQTKDIWAGMGLGSDLAAALESRRPAR